MRKRFSGEKGKGRTGRPKEKKRQKRGMIRTKFRKENDNKLKTTTTTTKYNVKCEQKATVKPKSGRWMSAIDP